MLDNHPINTTVCQRLQFVAQIRNTTWCARFVTGELCEVFTRVRLKSHHRSFDLQPSGRRRELLEQRTVAAMHAIEISDGERARATRFSVGESAKNSHGMAIERRRIENPRL